jgi:hypothetical protein
MSSVHVDSNLQYDDRRGALYQGDIFTYSADLASENYCTFAADLLRDAFETDSPESAELNMTNEHFNGIIAGVAHRFIYHAESKKFIQHVLLQRGCDPEQTYFDAPRLFTVSSRKPAHAKLAADAHRDTWVGLPMCSISWWMPVCNSELNHGVGIYPGYWKRPVKNGSAKYFPHLRKQEEESNQLSLSKPEILIAREPIESEGRIGITARPSGMILLSSAHLQSTMPNQTGKTLFSLSFRSLNIDDLVKGKGAPNVDSACKELLFGDFIRLSDFAHISEKLIAKIHPGKIPVALNV